MINLRSKPKIPLILLFFALLLISIVFGQFDLENTVNRSKSLFGSIFDRNAPKNGQNKLAKNTTTFSTNSMATTTMANVNINNSILIGNNNSDFGLTTLSAILSSENAMMGNTERHLTQNNLLFASMPTTTIHVFMNNSQMKNAKQQKISQIIESTPFGRNSMKNQPTSTIPIFSTMSSSTAPSSTLLNSNWQNSSTSSFSMPNSFFNTSFHHFESTNAITISPPISQINPPILNQNNEENLYNEQNGTKIIASNKLTESTESFTNQSKNVKEMNEFTTPTKTFLLEDKQQKRKQNHKEMKMENREEKIENGTSGRNGIGRILDGSNQNGSIQILINSLNRISFEEYSNATAINQQLFPSSFPFQQFVGNNLPNQSSNLPTTANFNNNSLNYLNILEKNLEKNNTEEMRKMNEQNGRQQNGNDNKIRQKEVPNNFGMVENNNKTLENENANQIFGNGTMKNERRIDVKSILKTANGIGNEMKMEISKTIRNEQNGTNELITEQIDEAKIERKLKMNKTENKLDRNGRVGSILNGNQQQNGLGGIQLNQTNGFGMNQTLLGEFGWNQTLTKENEQNQNNSVNGRKINQPIVGGNGIANPNKLSNGFGLNESSSARENLQSNETLIKQKAMLNKTKQIEGIQSKQENSNGIENIDRLNQTLTKQQETNLNKTKNSGGIPFNQLGMGIAIQNGNNNLPLITNSTTYETSNSTSTIQQLSITTTTQDPIVRKELEKAGAPNVLKQLVPPKAEQPIPEKAKQIIKDKCANGKCLEQKAEFKEQRILVSKQEEALEQKLNPGKPVKQIKKEVEKRISKTFLLKKELMKSAGLEGKVEPANNGVFQADLLLTEEQATALIAELERQRAQKGGKSSRKKRAGNAIFMENSVSQKWPLNTSIQFMFDQSLVEKDRQAVKQAIAEIQSKTCLKFIEAYSKPSVSHLYYTKIANPTFCGLSYVGRIEPSNPIYLSFLCGNEAGIGLHETLHALGFQHEQLRFDRDQFITIQWENVNPQQLDFFAISDVTKFSSYGLQYDYGSIMHYSATIASQNAGKKTMVAKLAPAINDPLMGQRKGLSLSDVDALNKIYCSPGCEDKLVYCGLWATLNLCNPQMWRRTVTHQWIVSNCQKSCNKCGEKLEPVSNRPF